MRPWLLYVIWFVLCGVLVLTTLDWRQAPAAGPTPVAFLQVTDPWVDSVLAQLSPRAQLAQLLLLAPVDSTDSLPVAGGVLLPPARLVAPPFMGLAPLVVRARPAPSDPGIRLPGPGALAAIADDSLLRLAGRWRGRELQAQGTQLWLSALVPAGVRGFGALAAGLAESGVLTGPGPWASYFPREWDSTRLRARLAPLRHLAQQGLPVLLLDSVDIAQVRPDAREAAVIRTYLDEMAGFQGLLLAPVTGPETGAIERAIKSGADLIVLPPSEYAQALRTLEGMVARGSLTPRDLAQRVRRSLLARRWTTQHPTAPPPPPDIAAWLNHRLLAASLTAQNAGGYLPLGPMDSRAVHLLAINGDFSALLAQMRAYGPVSYSQVRQPLGQPLPPLRLGYLARFSPVVIAWDDHTRVDSSRDAAFLASLAALQARTEVVQVHLDESPVSQLPLGPAAVQVYGQSALAQQLAGQALYGGLSPQGRGDTWPQTRLGYAPPEATGMARAALARIDSIVYAAIYAGAMPGCQVLVARRGQVIYHRAYGAHTYTRQRGVDETDLYDLASVTKVAATTVATMRLVSTGRLRLEDPLSRYFSDLLVDLDSIRQQDTLYRRLDSLGLPPADSLLGDFVRVAQRQGPGWRLDSFPVGEDSLMIIRRWVMGRQRRPARWASLSLGELLTHHSGLPAGLPILPYISYRKRGLGKYARYYRPAPDSLARREVAADLYLEDHYADSLWLATKQLHLHPERAYLYSDANLILVQQALDSLTGLSLDSLLQRELYRPLGMQHTMFRPRQRVAQERIVPTEYDGTWRGQLLRGYVHDPTAALLGGVSGNAGLFANASDLAHLFQMLLNGGQYAGTSFIAPEVVATFTRRQQGHRGYGFDLPPLRGDYLLSGYASAQTYGHSGFTGTCVWVDPEAELIYIFLSNRVHPRGNNWRLNELRVRQRIHDVIYEAIAAGVDSLP